METHWADILALVLYIVLVFGIGIWASCRAKTGDTSGYFLAGQSSHWLLTGTSTFSTNIGAPMFIGLAGSAAASGIAVVMFEWHAMLMLVALGWLFLPVYRACGCYTMPEYLQLRFGGGRIRLMIAIVSLLTSVLVLLSGQMYAGALFIKEVFRWDLYLAVTLILAATALYTIIGGLTAVLWTDAIQTLIIIAGSLTMSVIGLLQVGGWEGIKRLYPRAAANDTITDMVYGNKSCGLPRDDAFHIFRSHDSDFPWPGMIFGLTILATYAWCTDQICVQRSLAAKNMTHGKAGLLLAAYLKILPFLFFVIPGMIGRILYPDEVACADPVKCRDICGNPRGCSNVAYPLLVNRILPDGLRGLMLAALLASLMSSLTSIFNSCTTIFTLDIYKRIRRSAPETEIMIVGRLFVIFMMAASIAWLPILQEIQGSELWNYFQSIYSCLVPPFVSTFLAGIFWKRTTEKGAFYGVVVGEVIGLIRMVLSWIRPPEPCGSDQPDRQFSVIRSVHYLHYAMLSFGVSMVVTAVISWFTEPPTSQQLRRVTFWTRNDPEMHETSVEEVELQGNGRREECTPEMDSHKPEVKGTRGKFAHLFLRYICGVDNSAQQILTKVQLIELRRQTTDIRDDPKWTRFLNVNAAIAVVVCVVLHGVFG